MTCVELSCGWWYRWWSTLLFGELTAILPEVMAAASGLVVRDLRKRVNREVQRGGGGHFVLKQKPWAKCFCDHHEDCLTSGTK